MIDINDSQITALPEPASHWRVLIVEDDELVLRRLCALVLLGGYETHTATSGAAALRILTETPCQIVLTDWHMPDMDGLGLCRRWRRVCTGITGNQSGRGQLHRRETAPDPCRKADTNKCGPSRYYCEHRHFRPGDAAGTRRGVGVGSASCRGSRSLCEQTARQTRPRHECALTLISDDTNAP
jgi:hypothetical protein